MSKEKLFRYSNKDKNLFVDLTQENLEELGFEGKDKFLFNGIEFTFKKEHFRK